MIWGHEHDGLALPQELIDEGSDLQLDKDKMDRLLTAKLMLPKEGENTQWTLDYLLGVYARSQREQQSIAVLKDRALAVELDEICSLAQQLAVSFASTQLSYEVFPQVSACLSLDASKKHHLSHSTHSTLAWSTEGDSSNCRSFAQSISSCLRNVLFSYSTMCTVIPVFHV